MICLKYIYNLITGNPGKITMLSICVISIWLAFTINTTVERKYKIVSLFVNEKYDYISKYNYVIKKESSNNNFSVISFEKPPIIKNGFIIYNEEDYLYPALLWIVIVIFLTICLMATFNHDTDINWGFKDIRVKTYKQKIICEIDTKEGKSIYYYILDDRLITKSDHLIDDSYHLNSQISKYIKYPKLFPKFKTKRRERDDKLSKLLN